MPSYTLEIEAFGVYASNMPSLEIWEDGVLDSTHAISVSGSSIFVTINYGGALPTSLALTFNDAFAAAGRTIEIRSVKINNQYVNTGNYLSSDSLTKGQSATVDIGSTNTDDSDFLFDASEPALSEFTTGATRTLTAGNDTRRYHMGTADEVFDALAGRDVIYLGSGDDKVYGNAGNDLIRGGAGTDLLSGGADDDRIYGGDDNDTIYGGAGNDRLHGEDGDDEIHGGDGVDFLNGHAGDDVLTGGAGNDRLNGGDGTDFLYGGDDDDTLVGGGDDDTLDGGDGDDLAYGGAGNDHIDGGDGDDILMGHTGNDVINGGDDDDTIYGQQDDDELYGGDGADTLNGGDDDDTLSGDAGDDILDGGDDTDTASYISASSSVTADLGVENHALDFAGGNDSVHLSGLGLGGAAGSRATVEFWMEWDGTNNMMPFGFNTYDLWFYNGAFGFNNGSSLRYGISSAGLANTAVHVAAVFVDSDTLSSKLYINGVEQTLSILGGGVNNGNAQITTTARISGWATNNSYKFDGTIDDLRIWDGERTAAEINQYMDYSITGAQTDLEANYRFEDISTGAGGVIDSSGNANHGTLSGMTTGNQVTWGNSGISNGYSTGGADNDIIQNVENLIGSDFDDTLSGDRHDNVIEGRGGRDTIFGENGDDTLEGGDEVAASISNLIVNGGFEDTSNGTGSGVTPPNWTTIGTGWGVYAFGSGRGSEGSYAQPLGGWGPGTGGGVSQVVTTTIGENYDLLLDAGISFGSGTGTLRVTVSDVGGTIIQEDIVATAGGGMEQLFFNFQANSTSTTVSFVFQSASAGDKDYDIDNIRLFETNGDVLYGGDGLDTLTGGTGNDRFVFESATAFNDIDVITDFNTAERDVLDISDLISDFEIGINPVQDNITNFLQITDDGTDSSVFVDTTGTGTFGAATQIATIEGVVGLTNEQSLLNQSLIYVYDN